jgi:hypothetical protein
VSETVPDWWRPFAADFPQWEAWQGIERLYHARIKGATPPVLVRGESPQDLADEIKGWEGNHAEG